MYMLTDSNGFNCLNWNAMFQIPCQILNCICKGTDFNLLLFHPSRPWMAFSLWWTWRATSCLSLRTWPSTCTTTRRSSWTPVSTACFMLEIMLSSSRTCYQSPSVSQKLIFPPHLLFALWTVLLFAALLCHDYLCSLPHCITFTSAHKLSDSHFHFTLNSLNIASSLCF